MKILIISNLIQNDTDARLQNKKNISIMTDIWNSRPKIHFTKLLLLRKNIRRNGWTSWSIFNTHHGLLKIPSQDCIFPLFFSYARYYSVLVTTFSTHYAALTSHNQCSSCLQLIGYWEMQRIQLRLNLVILP